MTVQQQKNQSQSESFSLGEVSVSLSPAERFEEFLQSRGKRFTKQRQALIDEIFSRHEHFDADELLARIKESKLSRATVYRTLTELVEAGLLKSMMLQGRTVTNTTTGIPNTIICTVSNAGS